MKRIALLVLALAANVIADEEEDIQQVATNFETDVQTVKECMNKANITVVQMHIATQKWQEKYNEEIDEYDKEITEFFDEYDEKIKESFMPYGSFIACMLEKNDLMQDEKLVLDNILETLKKDKHRYISRINEESLTECVNSLNENSKIKEAKAIGLMTCIGRSLVKSDT
ncbi:hypothetical protein ACFW04_003735 [Cataglyphis niger]